jgi:hypothetical protein
MSPAAAAAAIGFTRKGRAAAGTAWALVPMQNKDLGSVGGAPAFRAKATGGPGGEMPTESEVQVLSSADQRPPRIRSQQAPRRMNFLGHAGPLSAP